jgi:hypothetical protein
MSTRTRRREVAVEKERRTVDPSLFTIGQETGIVHDFQHLHPKGVGPMGVPEFLHARVVALALGKILSMLLETALGVDRPTNIHISRSNVRHGVDTHDGGLAPLLRRAWARARYLFVVIDGVVAIQPALLTLIEQLAEHDQFEDREAESGRAVVDPILL